MSRILTLAGKKWLAGMSWRSYDKPPTRAIIRAEASSLGANAYLQRSGQIRTPMSVEPRYDAGYAVVGREVHKGTVYSLGAALSGAKPGPWIGIFRLNESLFYYIAIDQDGAIVPDQYGEIVGSASEIEQARSTHADLFEVTPLEGDLKTLEMMLVALTGPFIRVYPVARGVHLNVFQLVPAVAFIALLVGAGELYRWHQAQLAQQVATARLAALIKAHNTIPPQSPLQKEPEPGTWLKACNPGRWRLPAIDNGWTLNQYQCLSNEVDITWVRGSGATPLARPPGTLDPTGNFITQLIPLHLMPPKIARRGMRPESEPKTVELAQARAELQAWAEEGGIVVEFGTPSALPGFPLKQCAVTLSSPLVPWSLTSLDRVIGLRLASFNSTQSGEWVLKGVLYGK